MPVKRVHHEQLDDRHLEVHERTEMVFFGLAPMPMVVETIYVWTAPDWPKTRIRARRGLARLSYALGRHPGLALDDPEFNRAFRVDAEGEDFAIAVLSPEMQGFLLEKRSVDWSLGRGALKLFYRGELKRKRMEQSFDRLRRFWALLPEELRAAR